MKVQGIFLSWIVVKNIKAAIKFYTEVVGLELKQFHEEFNWAEMSGPDGCILGIGQEEAESPIRAGVNAIVTITVENIEDAKTHYTKKGATLVGETIVIPGHVKMQSFVDADNNMMQIVETLS